MTIQGMMIGVQFFFTCVIGIYFLQQLSSNKSTKVNIHSDTAEKLEKMNRLRQIKLNEPLTEKMRPKEEADIIGQEEGVKALKNALCTPNPQHIIIYGSPGVGKTAAARLALEAAKKSPLTSFRKDAPFIEIDATTLRFDERSVADPLIGSVHDPIYQGAGAYGSAGVPQPKMGAVTKAHGGILFIDEIGELHPIQMNKLLKVLEDRKVFLESSYYHGSDTSIPRHIHDIFQNGLPADFRLIGATTRQREDLPPALRSRCVEIDFKDLEKEHLQQIIRNTVKRHPIALEEGVECLIAEYAGSGRDAVTILQTAYNKLLMEDKKTITIDDVEWVVASGRYNRQLHKKLNTGYDIGKVSGLGVVGSQKGAILEIEVLAKKVPKDQGRVKITGIIEEETIKSRQHTTTRKSMAYSSLENVLTVLRIHYNIDVDSFYIHINYPTGIPVDGPSAGISMFLAIYSAITNQPIPRQLAMTGEMTIQGKIYPVGGIKEKIKAAKYAGATAVLIPEANRQEAFGELALDIIPIDTIDEAIHYIWEQPVIKKATKALHA